MSITLEGRILTIKNLINPAIMPGYSEISGQAFNSHAADAINVVVDNIPARSIISAIGTSCVTADGTVPVGVGTLIADGTKAGTKKVTFVGVVAVNTLNFTIKYSESEVISAPVDDSGITLYALQ